jgi:Rieske Fe-S protein
MKRANRRDFLKLVTNTLLTLGGLLGLGGLIRFFSFQPDPGPPTEFELGNADNYPPGTRTVRADIPAVLYNQDGIFRAYSLTCTHLGCTLEEDGEGYTCPCHGSCFSHDGQVTQGPAQDPLPQLLVEISTENTLIVYRDKKPDI